MLEEQCVVHEAEREIGLLAQSRLISFILKYKSNESWTHPSTTTSSSTIAVEPECEDGLNGIDLRSKHTGASLATIDPVRAAAEATRLKLGHDACTT